MEIEKLIGVGAEYQSLMINEIETRTKAPVLLLLCGKPGTGKSQTAYNIACHVTGNEAMAKMVMVNGVTLGVDGAVALITSLHYSPLTGSVNISVIDEIDKASDQCVKYMLSALTMLENCVIICTSNKSKDDLPYAFASRFACYDYTPPAAIEVYSHLMSIGIIDVIAQAICEQYDGDVRNALKCAKSAQKALEYKMKKAA